MLLYSLGNFRVIFRVAESQSFPQIGNPLLSGQAERECKWLSILLFPYSIPFLLAKRENAEFGLSCRLLRNRISCYFLGQRNFNLLLQFQILW